MTWPAKILHYFPPSSPAEKNNASSSTLNGRSVTFYRQDEVPEDFECRICFEDHHSDNILTGHGPKRGDKHIFHELCIQQWMERTPTCPLCRAGIEKLSDQPEPQFDLNAMIHLLALTILGILGVYFILI